MSVSTLHAPSISSLPMTRKKLTADEVEQMEEAGLFEDSRFELIDGELIDKMGQKPPHVKAIGLCAKLLRKIFGEDMVHAQAPVSAGAQDRKTSVPEPDVRVLAGDKPDFAYRHPQGPEVALLVEVSDTTLRRDTLTKRDLYARSGVPEYRVLDLTGRREYKTDFKRCHPKGNELMLAVEVSHTTLEHDAWTKRDLYARAGVPEYWILDLTYPRLLVFSELNTEKGEYASLKGYTAEDSVTFASKTIPVSALLPKS